MAYGVAVLERRNIDQLRVPGCRSVVVFTLRGLLRWALRQGNGTGIMLTSVTRLEPQMVPL